MLMKLVPGLLLACSLALAAPPPGPRLSAPPPRARTLTKKAPSAAARLQQLAGVPPPGPRLQAPAHRLLSRPGTKLVPARRKQKQRNNPIVQVLNSFMSLLSFGARKSSKKTAHPKRLTVAKPKPKHVKKHHKLMLNSHNKRLKSLKHPKSPPRQPRPPAPPSVVTRPDKGEVKRLVVALHSRLEAVLAQQTAASLPPSPDPGHSSSSRFQTVFASDAKAGHQGRRK